MMIGKTSHRRLLAALVAEAALILWMSAHGDFLQKGEAWKFTALGMSAGVAYWVAAQALNRPGLSERQSTAIFWLAAVGLRLLILPVLAGDDVWRYRWEGMIQLHGFNPYQLGPDAPALAHLRDADWLKINHRDHAAIYPPLTEAVFAAIAAAGNAVWLFKVLFALADLASVALLRRLLARSGVAAENAAWYAWNPLMIYAFAGAAHFDSLMICALLGAIGVLDGFSRRRGAAGSDRESPGVSADYWISASLLGTAVAIKIVPVVLLPGWALAAGSWRRALGLWPVALAPLALTALAYGFPGTPIFRPLQQFGDSFRVNDPFWWLLDVAGGPGFLQSNRLHAACTLAVCCALADRFRREWRRGMLWTFGAFLLLSPVVHAWYVAWVLPLAVWRGARAWFVFSLSTFGYFLLWEVNHASGQPWQEPLWLRGIILLPPLVALGWMGGIRPPPFGPGGGESNPLKSGGSGTNIPE